MIMFWGEDKFSPHFLYKRNFTLKGWDDYNET